MRSLLVVATLLLSPLGATEAQVSVGIDIGLHVPVYPELVLVPGYPVYYDRTASTNYFFHDGLYWVFQDDSWYASSWYDGPWHWVGPEAVPVFLLRVPVRYYRRPPAYFHGWRGDAPPRWGQHWGRGWERRRGGWDRWDRHAAPRPAPLPAYQRHYAGDRYPREVERQHALRAEHDRYRPRDAMTRRHLQPARATPAPRHDRGPQAHGDGRVPQDRDRAYRPDRQEHPRADPPASGERGRGHQAESRRQDRDGRDGERGPQHR